MGPRFVHGHNLVMVMILDTETLGVVNIRFLREIIDSR